MLYFIITCQNSKIFLFLKFLAAIENLFLPVSFLESGIFLISYLISSFYWSSDLSIYSPRSSLILYLLLELLEANWDSVSLSMVIHLETPLETLLARVLVSLLVSLLGSVIASLPGLCRYISIFEATLDSRVQRASLLPTPSMVHYLHWVSFLFSFLSEKSKQSGL